MHVQKPVRISTSRQQADLAQKASRIPQPREPRRTDSRVSLRDTASHSTEQSSRRRSDTGGHGDALDFCRGEEEDGALCRGFDPGPGDQALVDCSPPIRSMSAMPLDGQAGRKERENAHPRTPPRDQTVRKA